MSPSLLGVVVLALIGCGGAANQGSTAPPETDRTIQKHDMHAGHMGQMGHMNEGGQMGEMGHMGEMGQMGQMDKKGEHGEMAEMAALPPEVKKFHETLAPRWHAEHGPQRMTDTCSAMPQLHADVEAIAAATPPNGAKPADWSASAKQLADAVAALDTTCKASDATAFEQAFAAVHDRFHGLMAAGGESQDKPADPGHAEHHH